MRGRSYKERREECRRYEGEVVYQVWRGGGNPDAVNLDSVDDDYYAGVDCDQSAASELRRQRPARPDNENEGAW